MARSEQELLTAIEAAEAELQLMAGYETDYPEHYQALQAALDQVLAEYASAMAANAPFAAAEPVKTSSTSSSSSGEPRHIAVQDVIVVAGRGDRIVLLHPEDAEDEEQGASDGGSSGGGASDGGTTDGGVADGGTDVGTPDGGSSVDDSPEFSDGGDTTSPPGGAPDEPSATDGQQETGQQETGAPVTGGEPAKPPPQDSQSGSPSVVDEFPPGPPEAQSQSIEKVEADAWKGGYGHLRIRPDVAKVYNAFREEVLERGAIITSSGGIRDLNADVGASRSATSFHYSGRAIDLFIYSGMNDPAKDPYVVVREEARVYRVYARCSSDHAEVHDLSNVMTYHKRDGSLSTSGDFFDLTALFKKYGFERIRARESFESGGAQLGAEWWHFQCELGLTKGTSTFGEELLAMYSEATLKPTPPWEYRSRVFGVNWN